MSLEQAKLLAAWRLSGGVYHIQYVVEGFDDTHEVLLPGKLSQEFAEKLGAYRLAKILGVRHRLIIHKETRKEA